MGARGSAPRTVHLENDSPTSVIDVSEAVVDRLKGLHTKGLYVFFTLPFIEKITSKFSDFDVFM